MHSFWQHASTQQRLAQIDGAIECGLTIKQTAVNLGTVEHVVGHFARRNGRHYSANQPNEFAHIASKQTQRRQRGTFEIFAKDAFEIFPSRAKEDHILDKRGDE